MFREMRRKKQLLPEAESREILARNTSGVLSLLGDGGYPYGVPLSYVLAGDNIFFHCAKEGHKIDAIRREEKASFCVIDQDQIVSEEYTTYFRSVIAFGRAHILESDEEKMDAIHILAGKYSGDQGEAGIHKEIGKHFANLCMIQFDIEHLTGKEAIELVRMKQK
ncbi:MAG: pyridoxamine 5'-phosphate oxidase family protein [Anaerotignum sp.]|nr:pyridoxamine 5'-phosphate oxidase family protein [Anaerotignum sp.]